MVIQSSALDKESRNKDWKSQPGKRSWEETEAGSGCRAGLVFYPPIGKAILLDSHEPFHCNFPSHKPYFLPIPPPPNFST